MTKSILTQSHLTAYARFLASEERASSTIEKYSRALEAFAVWLAGREVTKEMVTQWKAHLLENGQSPSTVNAKLAAVNGLSLIFSAGPMTVSFPNLCPVRSSFFLEYGSIIPPFPLPGPGHRIYILLINWGNGVL